MNDILWSGFLTVAVLCVAAFLFGAILRFVRHLTIAGLLEDRDDLRASLDQACGERDLEAINPILAELQRVNEHLEALGVDTRTL